MLKLENVDIDNFKKDMYSYYKRIFPSLERKSFNKLKRLNKLGVNHFIKITDDNNFVGFMIVNVVDEIKYVQLDYFAILPQYQDKGYGIKALKELQSNYKEFDLIFIEAETVGKGKNDNENKQRTRRDKFYKNAKFIPLNYEFNLYKVIYTPYILYINEKSKYKDEQEIVDRIFRLYSKTIEQNVENLIRIAVIENVVNKFKSNSYDFRKGKINE